MPTPHFHSPCDISGYIYFYSLGAFSRGPGLEADTSIVWVGRDLPAPIIPTFQELSFLPSQLYDFRRERATKVLQDTLCSHGHYLLGLEATTELRVNSF